MLGIGVNVGAAPWPGAGSVDRDRLELLVEILDRLERGYDRWADAAHGPVTGGPLFPAASAAWTVNEVTGPPCHGTVNVPAASGDDDRLPVHDGGHGRRLAELEAERRPVETASATEPSCRS